MSHRLPIMGWCTSIPSTSLELRDEGTAVRYLEINGVWEDHIRYAITAEEWKDRRMDLLTDWVYPEG